MESMGLHPTPRAGHVIRYQPDLLVPRPPRRQSATANAMTIHHQVTSTASWVYGEPRWNLARTALAHRGKDAFSRAQHAVGGDVLNGPHEMCLDDGNASLEPHRRTERVWRIGHKTSDEKNPCIHLRFLETKAPQFHRNILNIVCGTPRPVLCISDSILHPILELRPRILKVLSILQRRQFAIPPYRTDTCYCRGGDYSNSWTFRTKRQRDSRACGSADNCLPKRGSCD